MAVIKILGCMSVIFCCTFFGINRAQTLKKRAETLTKLILSMDAFIQYIRIGNDDINTILKRNLPKGITVCREGIYAEGKMGLNDEDRTLLNEFFKEMGMGDRESEINRCESYKILIEKQLKKAEMDIDEKYKVFSYCGFMTGIVLSLLWW